MILRPSRVLGPALVALASGASPPIDGPCCPTGPRPAAPAGMSPYSAEFVPPASEFRPGVVGPIAPMPGVALNWTGWRGPAERITQQRLSPAFYRLRASVRWLGGAPADPNRYRVAIDPPAGRPSRSYPLAPGDQPGAGGLTVWVPVEAVADLPASRVLLSARLIDSATGRTVSDGPLAATIDQFPNPGDLVPAAPREFGWGTPLKAAEGGGQALARRPYSPGETDLNEGPQGYQFARVFRQGDKPGFFASTTEATLDQVSGFLKEKGYSPNLRPGEFTFTGESPAIGVSPANAEAYLVALGASEGLGLRYRLPTKDEWSRLARAGRPTRFWWGDDPDDEPAKLGANFKGSERPRPGSTREDEADVIRPTATGGISSGGFRPSPWGLFHTFGNVAEWATEPGGNALWLLGGTFRTDRDRANFRPEDLEVPIKSADAFDADANPFAGVRPVVEVAPEAGASIARKLLVGDRPDSGPFKDVRVDYDPETATADLSGEVDDPFVRQKAGEALRPLWFLAAVRDRIAVRNPTPPADRVASIAGEADSSRVTLSYVVDDRIYSVPVGITWAETLPVDGSTLWLNVFRAEGPLVSASRVNPVEVGRASELRVPIDGAKMAAAGLAVDAPVRIALSLGKSPASSANDPGIVSEVVALRWRLDRGRFVASGRSGRGRPGR